MARDFQSQSDSDDEHISDSSLFSNESRASLLRCMDQLRV